MLRGNRVFVEQVNRIDTRQGVQGTPRSSFNFTYYQLSINSIVAESGNVGRFLHFHGVRKITRHLKCLQIKFLYRLMTSVFKIFVFVRENPVLS